MSATSERITALREQRGWSKTHVAKKLGLNLSTYANYEYGNREPDIKTLADIAKLFEVTTDYLVNGTTPGEDKPLSKNQKLVAYSIDPGISDEERRDIIEMVKIAIKNRRRV